MKPFAKILVATDLGPGSAHLLDLALATRAYSGGTLHVLHVFELGNLAYLDQASGKQNIHAAAAERALQKFVAGARRSYPQLGATLVEGTPAAEILRAAKEGGYDLVITGTHGRRGVSRLLLGSVASEVIRASAVPVLVVPTRAGQDSHEAP